MEKKGTMMMMTMTKTAMCLLGGVGRGVVLHSFNMFEIVRKLVKGRPCCKSGGHTVFSWPFVLVTLVGQMVKKGPPPKGRCLGTSLDEDDMIMIITLVMVKGSQQQ